jgi:hypothetical protein
MRNCKGSRQHLKRDGRTELGRASARASAHAAAAACTTLLSCKQHEAKPGSVEMRCGSKLASRTGPTTFNICSVLMTACRAASNLLIPKQIFGAQRSHSITAGSMPGIVHSSPEHLLWVPPGALWQCGAAPKPLKLASKDRVTSAACLVQNAEPKNAALPLLPVKGQRRVLTQCFRTVQSRVHDQGADMSKTA